MILSMRLNWFKVIASLIMIPLKGIFVGWDSGAITSIYVFIISIMFDVFLRRSFRLHYEANETLKKF